MKKIITVAMACLIGLAIIWQELPSHSGKILIPWMLLSTALLYQPLQKGLNTLRGKPTEKIIFAIICIMLLVLPLFHLNMSEKSEAENRNLAIFPQISLKAFYEGTLTANLENYFNDRFFGRELYVKISNLYNGGMTLNKHYENSRALSGRDNWLFYKGEDSLELYQNMHLFKSNEYPVIQKNLESMKNWLEDYGIKFYVIYPPNKEDVYGDYIGRGIKKRIQPDTDRIALVVNYLKSHESGVVPIYPLEVMLEEKKRSDTFLYYKTDTHWSPYGAYIGYKALMNVIGNDFIDVDTLLSENMDFTKKVKLDNGDLAQMLDMDFTQEMQDVWYVEPRPINGWHYILKEEQLASKNNIDYRRTVNLHGKYKVIIFRDSFGINLLPYLSETFRDVSYYWTYDIDKYKDIIAREKPDFVILESVSRLAQYSLFNDRF